ncbi:MAG: hypothetical protein AAFY36_01395 [Bacteroidota bacterium]
MGLTYGWYILGNKSFSEVYCLNTYQKDTLIMCSGSCKIDALVGQVRQNKNSQHHIGQTEKLGFQWFFTEEAENNFKLSNTALNIEQTKPNTGGLATGRDDSKRLYRPPRLG